MTALLVAALTASAHAIGRGSEANAAATSADTDEHESPCRRRWPLRLAHKHSSGLTTRLKARLMQGCCWPHQSTSGLLLCTICMHYVHHMQEGADDVSGLLIAALTASAHAIGRGSEGGCSTCDAVLLQPI